VIQSVRYTNASDTPPASVVLAYGFQDGQGVGAGHLDVETVTVNIGAVNDAPLNTVPAAQAGNEDTDLVFSTANGNAISVADLDAATLRVTLGVGHGTLTLSTTAGLSFNSGANGTGAMTFTGSAAAINAALNGLVYRGNLNYFGSETLSVTTTDLGATGSGGTQSDLDAVAITLAADGIIHGTAGNNVLVGTGGPDMFRIEQGGNDNASGLGGDDIFFFGAAMTAADIVNGGGGWDTIGLQGNYSGGLPLNGNVTNIEAYALLSGSNTAFGEPGTNLYDYNLTVADANSTSTLIKVNGATLLAGEDFVFNGAAEDDSAFLVYGGRGNDNLTGGALGDIFFFCELGQYQPGDVINGGGGADGLFLRGDYTINYNAAGWGAAFQNLESINLISFGDKTHATLGDGEFDYNLTFADVLLATGQMMTINGAQLAANETLVFNGSAETGGQFQIRGGAAGDALRGGGGADVISGGGGGDLLIGNGGADRFEYAATGQSTTGGIDRIDDFAHLLDKIDLSLIDARPSLAGDQAFTFIGSAAFTAGNTGQVRAFQVSPGLWYVQADINGDRNADLTIHVAVQGGQPLTSADFIF